MSATVRRFVDFAGPAFAWALIALSPPAARAQADQALVDKGKYLATAGDCAACHTAPGGVKFAGGLMMNTPFGPISTPNITPDKDTGIGSWSDDQFVRTFHEGLGKDGEHLYPVMPFPWYVKVSREDVLAIKAYLFSLTPVHAPRKPNNLSFPFNIRAGLAVWDEVFLRGGTFKPDPAKSAEVNRGAYLVQGLGHCGECHNGYNMLGDTSMAEPLRGGQIDHWYAPNITSDVHDGIGRFSDTQLVDYLKTGSAPGMGTVVGPMAQTVHESLSKLTDPDLHAIVAYLKSTGAEPGYTPSHPSDFKTADPTGAQTYLTYCASCHQLDGKGIADVIPPLAGNGAVKNGGPQDVIRVVLGGVEAQGTYAPMTAIGAGMTDQQVANVVNYVRQSWSNDAPADAGPGDVASLRKITHTLLSGTDPGGCPALAQPDMAKLVDDPSTGIKDLMTGITASNMLQRVDQILLKVKAADPTAKQADIVNSLTIAYCPILAQDSSVKGRDQALLLGQFSERVYTQIAQHEKL